MIMIVMIVIVIKVIVTSPDMSPSVLVPPVSRTVVLYQAVVVGDGGVQPGLLAGVSVSPQPQLLLLLLAVVLHVLPQAARVSVLLEAAQHFTLVRFLQS